MPPINLLPTELVPKKGAIKTSNLIKQVTTVGFTVLSIIIMGIIGYFVYLNSQFSSLERVNNQLVTEIEALEGTEQQFFLTKNRLKGIKEVYSADSQLDKILQIKSSFPPEVQVSETEVSSEGIGLVFFSPNASSISKVLETIYQSELFDGVLLKSFGFNPVSGYTVTLLMS